MELTIFAKKRTNREGKHFYGYLTQLTKKDGSTQVVSVSFKESCGSPKPEECPVNIKVNKSCANLTAKKFEREDTGEEAVSYTLWVNSWVRSETTYVDHSLDEYV